jgi:hypothetical protein
MTGMNNDEKLGNKKSENFADNQTSLSKLYKELNQAINSNNIQSIWELSKTITRYHFRKIDI